MPILRDLPKGVWGTHLLGIKLYVPSSLTPSDNPPTALAL